MKRFLAVLILLTSVLSLAQAQVISRARLYDPASISQQTHPNGVRSVVQEATGGDLVSVQVWVRAGSRFETPENNGVTHLVETLALEGSKNYPAAGGGPREAIRKLGGFSGSLSSRDDLFLSFTISAANLPAALRIAADATLAPELSDSAVNLAKPQLLSELVAASGDPVRVAADLAYSTAFDKHPYRMNAQGTPVSLRALTGAKARAYHAARFTGGNISVVIVGDVQRATAHALVARIFAAAVKATPTAGPAAEAAPKTIKRDSRRGMLPVTTMTLAWRSPGIDDPSSVVALDVLLSHWKEGRDAALRRVLQAAPIKSGRSDEDLGELDEGEEKEGEGKEGGNKPEAPSLEEKTPLALAFDADYLTQRDSGLFLITVVGPRDRETVVQVLLDEVNRVRTDGLTPAELTRAKFYLTQQYIEQSESVSGLNGALGFYEMINDYRFAASYLDRISKVTNDDIKRMANRYIDPAAYVQATIEGRANTPPPDNGTIVAQLPRTARPTNTNTGEGL